jgi:hypothetical protein
MAKTPAEIEAQGYMPMAKASKLLGIGEERIRQLIKEGYIQRSPHRGYVLTVSAVQGYIASLKDDIKKLQSSSSQNRARDTRADLLKMQIEEKRRLLVQMTEIEAIVQAVFGVLKSELDGIAAGVSRDRELRNRIQERVDGAFKRATKAFRDWLDTGAIKPV